MPELPEVETVKNTLKNQIINKQIKTVKVYYPGIIANKQPKDFIKELENETIQDIKRKGKWLIYELDNHYLLSHLRMEGKYILKDPSFPQEKHQHIIFQFTDETDLRYVDTRKFGKMYLFNKNENIFAKPPLNELGLEPWDDKLVPNYLKKQYQNKIIPIKTALLDQGIITGIGNIYADEILFLSKINPLEPCQSLTNLQLERIITNTKAVLQEAIKAGGTTIISYESSEGVHGRFQQQLNVHTKEGQPCPHCKSDIVKIKVNGRGTYYCPKCQKQKN